MATLAAGIMVPIVLGSQATTVVATVSTNLIVGTIVSTTSSIGSMISYLTSSNQPGIADIVSILAVIDLEFTINIIQQVVKEQEEKPLNDSIKQALIGVNAILVKINEELASIRKAIEYHHAKYFSGWRGFSWTGSLDVLKGHNEILKHRYSLLFELLKIYNKTT